MTTEQMPEQTLPPVARPDWASQHRLAAGVAAVLAGMAVGALGDWISGVRLEIFQGMSTFTPAWMGDVFVVNFLVGLMVAAIFGRHAKWLAIVPPLLLRSISYLYLYFTMPHPDFFLNLHLFYWGPTLILAVECANLGAILGEVRKGVYRRKPYNPADLSPRPDAPHS